MRKVQLSLLGLMMTSGFAMADHHQGHQQGCQHQGQQCQQQKPQVQQQQQVEQQQEQQKQQCQQTPSWDVLDTNSAAEGSWGVAYWHCAAFPNNDPHHTHAHNAYGYSRHQAYYSAMRSCQYYHRHCHAHCHYHH